MIIDKNSLQTNVRRQIEYYERKCLLMDVKNQKHLLIACLIVGFLNFLDKASDIVEFGGGHIISTLSTCLLFYAIYFIVRKIKLIYRISREGYTLVWGEVSGIRTHEEMKEDLSFKITYEHTIIFDGMTFNVSPTRFITRDFRHINNEKKFSKIFKQIFPLYNTRLCFVDMKTQEVIFDLTDFIRL